MAADPPFESIAIVGLGLIGGSIALGVRERWPQSRVFGVDSEAVLAHAVGAGAIERGFESIAALPDASLIILAAPVRQNIELLSQVPVVSGFSRTVTDVGGTKREIVNAARALPSNVTFVGGHPLGGGERGGFAFARPDLFAGRPWIFTPAGHASTAAVDRLSRFVRGLGAKPSILSADDHDHVMAFISHLPQLAASALMETVGTAAKADGLRMAGRGLVDTTRLASSPADVWRDICLTNADAIEDALDCLIQRLTQLRGDLRRGDSVEAIFAAAAKWRAELMKDNH
ncbi:MAG: prephenate dehydrogenase/arogenate dehydrogenase family protein [Acidobacteria bacterium]|nr:MAG: prephenate dehydrogenase/arogenate dehydrogenase family protein [Acidobacteriota bacterium]